MGQLFEAEPTSGVGCVAISHNLSDIVLLQVLQVIGLLFVLFLATTQTTAGSR